MSNHNKNNNLNYLIDSTFSKFNRLFVLPFENEDDRVCFSKYFATTVEIADYNVLVDGKSFSDIPIKQQRKNSCKNY